MRAVVCPVEALPPGEMVRVMLNSIPVVVVRTRAGRLHALLDRCLHQGAPLSAGRTLHGVEGDRPGEYRQAADRDVIKCPWHGYEYEVDSGATFFDRRRCLRAFAVSEEEGQIVVSGRNAGPNRRQHGARAVGAGHQERPEDPPADPHPEI